MTDATGPQSPTAPAPKADRDPAPWLAAILRPILGFRRRYLPLIMVYFAYGALGLIDVTRDMWIKESLTLSPSELAGIGVWLSLPWTVKMVFGQLVDSVPIFGSQRRSYVLIGAALTACGMLGLAAAAAGKLMFVRPEQAYLLGSLLIVIGALVQDVVADAMSTEVVPRTDDAGHPRAEHDIRAELGLVQVLGRLALSFGILAVAGASGWLAGLLEGSTGLLLGLIVPAISVLGIFLIRAEQVERRPLDWRILGGGIVFGAVVVALGAGAVPFAQEVIFALSMVVICTMLVLVTRELDAASRRAILYTGVIIFAFRATPSVGDGYFWWTLDVLKFDEAFYGTLRQTGAILSIVGLWVFSRQLTDYSAAKVLFWLTVAGMVFSLPNIALFYGIQDWTEAMFGFGARTIAILDAATASPFAQLSMIPLLTLIAFYAPASQRATWFALMASFMNLALVAGQLGTKYLNQIFVVERGTYGELGMLLITATALAFLIPVAAIMLVGRRV